jgi:hypothetical protein
MPLVSYILDGRLHTPFTHAKLITSELNALRKLLGPGSSAKNHWGTALDARVQIHIALR